MNLNKRQQLLAVLAIAAVGFFVADKMIIGPLTNSWKTRSARIAKLKNDVRDGTETMNREKALRDQWGHMQQNTLSPVKSEAESQMIKAFERWSQEGGVSVSSVRPQWKESEDDYKTLECRADVAGSLSAISKFLYQVERDPLGIKVDTMELTARDADGTQLALVIQVSGLLLNETTTAKR
jgi:Tfp pilus assembly protein PilO